jgi:NTP pyrophosphatase (non-canonical NTP hydrolase)
VTSPQVVRDLLAEAEDAARKYGDYTSTHEALGVLIEEMDELREAVRRNVLKSIEREALQVGAVSLRLADHCRQALTAEKAGEQTTFSVRSAKHDEQLGLFASAKTEGGT